MSDMHFCLLLVIRPDTQKPAEQEIANFQLFKQNLAGP